MTFKKAWGYESGGAPMGLVLGASNPAAAAAQPYLVSKSTTAFVIGLNNPPSGAVAMSIDWIALG